MNNKMKVASWLLVLAYSTVTFAATEAEDVVVVKRSAKEIYADSSEANRIDKKFDFHYTLLGVDANSASGQGFTIGYFLERNKQVLAEVKSGKGAVTRYRSESYNGAFKEWSTDAQIKQVGVHFKHFVGNSFYYRAGGDYRTVDYKYDLNGSFFDDVSSSAFKSTAIIGSFVIGNQWQWDNFTLGCDWIGLAAPLTYSISGDQVPSSAKDKADFESDKKVYVTDSSGILLRFYLGASF